MRIDVDVVVIGSGFGGSIVSLLLQRLGLRVAMVDRGQHPRFAIGESSTPVADSLLRSLDKKYNLPRLAPLSTYGTWQATYPQLVCGLKRGFSYFQHVPQEPFVARSDHSNELLVAASSNEADSDTHWLRADVDRFLAEEAVAAGVPLIDNCELTPQQTPRGWQLTGHRFAEPVEIQATFAIDGSGEGGVLCKALGIQNDAQGLHTHSRTIFAHFSKLGSWHQQLAQDDRCFKDHPFCCDDAALHQVIDEGWMWQLRFNNGVTSAGFVLDAAEHALDSTVTIDQEWRSLLQRYPSIAEQFAPTKIVAPPGGLRRSPRLQRWAARMAGDNWALLPSTAGFIDPLHSTGIAHTLCGIERLAAILGEHWQKPSLAEQMREYHSSLRREIALIDLLVSGCYATRRNFPMFVAFVMLYFVGATTYEHRRFAAAGDFRGEFLSADNAEFRLVCESVWTEAQQLMKNSSITESVAERFAASVAAAIQPFNRVGLFHPPVTNMYQHTAAPR
jgi:FADH2 O2-dependent halogenase